MHSKHVQIRAEAHRLAVLALVWGLVAAVAYFGLIKHVVALIMTATGWAGPSTGFDSGLITIDPGQAGQVGHAHTSLYTTAIAALPIAILVIVGLSILARVRPTATLLIGLLIPAALLGLVGTLLLFLDVVATVRNRNDFVLALATLVVIAVLLRLQRFMRHYYRRNPAVVSVIVGLVVLIYIFVTTGTTNISTIVLTDIDIWLALAAFLIALYCGVVLLRRGHALRRAG